MFTLYFLQIYNVFELKKELLRFCIKIYYFRIKKTNGKHFSSIDSIF